MVTADGSVRPCCFASGQLGNLNESSIEDIWNGPGAIELRRFIKADKIHPMCAGAPCKFVQNMRAPYGAGEPSRQDEFDEDWYLGVNPDVAKAVQDGRLKSGWDHYVQYGRAEGRRARILDTIKKI